MLLKQKNKKFFEHLTSFFLLLNGDLRKIEEGRLLLKCLGILDIIFFPSFIFLIPIYFMYPLFDSKIFFVFKFIYGVLIPLPSFIFMSLTLAKAIISLAITAVISPVILFYHLSIKLYFKFNSLGKYVASSLGLKKEYMSLDITQRDLFYYFCYKYWEKSEFNTIANAMILAMSELNKLIKNVPDNIKYQINALYIDLLSSDSDFFNIFDALINNINYIKQQQIRAKDHYLVIKSFNFNVSSTVLSFLYGPDLNELQRICRQHPFLKPLIETGYLGLVLRKLGVNLNEVAEKIKEEGPPVPSVLLAAKGYLKEKESPVVAKAKIQEVRSNTPELAVKLLGITQ